MKHFSLLLALLAMPDFALSQTTVNPAPLPAQGQSKAPKTELPDADELLDHLFDPYEAAKTFRGTFDVSLENTDGKQTPPFSSLHIETRFRFNAQGDKTGEFTTLSVVGKVKGKDERQTLRLVDDGKTASFIYLEQKAWHLMPRQAMPLFRSFLQPILEQSTKGLNDDVGFEAAVAKGVDAGRNTYVLSDKEGQASFQFRAVVDAQTRALRSFELSGDEGKVSMSGFRQTFNAPIPDSQFKWMPPTGFRRVKEGSIPLPPFLQPAKPTQKSANAPTKATPAPTKPTSK